MLFLLSAVVALASVQIQDSRAWNQQYKDREAAAAAEQMESPARAVFRYRAAIAGLMQLKPGMTAAEVGAGSGFLARAMAPQVAPGGRVIVASLDPRLLVYVVDRARAEGLEGITAVPAQPSSTGLPTGAVDALALVNTLGTLKQPGEMVQSVAAALKPGGTLLVVDLPREGQGAAAVGIDAEDVIALAAAAGFDRVSESTVVPGQYAIRFRKR